MAFKSLAFLKFLDKVKDLPTVYMWGMFGDKVSEYWIQYKKEQYPTRYSNARIKTLRTHIGKSIGCDCCGLIKWFMMTNGDYTKKPKYKEEYDNNASDWYEIAPEKGTIDTIPEIPGLGVYKKGHIGVYIGKGKVCECTLTSKHDGVVVTNLKDVKWTHWLKIKGIDYPEVKVENTLDIDKLVREVIDGKWGNNPNRKKKLVKLYGEDVYKAIQNKVNEIYKKKQEAR
jgi:hypothetical protein